MKEAMPPNQGEDDQARVFFDRNYNIEDKESLEGGAEGLVFSQLLFAVMAAS